MSGRGWIIGFSLVGTGLPRRYPLSLRYSEASAPRNDDVNTKGQQVT